MAAAPRRRRLPGHRRRVEDEGEDDGGPDALDLLDDDSLTEGSVATEDHDAADDSDTSNVDEASPTSPNARKSLGNGLARPGRGNKKSETADKTARATVTDTEIMLSGLSLSETAVPVQEMHFDDLHQSPIKSAAPMVVSSASASAPKPQNQNQQSEPPYERRRREHEEYRRKRDEDPAFVPNRGAFFMHDHRGAGPSANGFRPFSRGGGRGGRGRGGFVGQGQGHFPFLNHGQMAHAPDPTTNAPWAHDMHEAVAAEHVAVPNPRHTQYVFNTGEGPHNGSNSIPRRQPNPQPINRTLSTEKHIGNAQVRVFFPPMKEPRVFTGVAMKQYTKLPDHRPPLRRDKPVRISLPDFSPRYIFPATDRSFIFIPRAMRPNQRGARGKPRSVFGSVGGFSRRTSIYGGGGGSFYGSVYSPSVAMSRRSSITHDMGRDYIISPTGSTMSRPPLPLDTSRQPVVRLPPAGPFTHQLSPQGPLPAVDGTAAVAPAEGDGQPAAEEASINDFPQPQVHPLPQKPNFQESRPSNLPMHQPRPQKTVSVETIESPTMSLNPAQPFQQAFHQQVPVQVSHNHLSQDSHPRRPSHPSQHSTGTPLSQIPERAIHAAPFQPNMYAQQQQQQHQHQQPHQNYYGQQQYPMMQQQQPSYYYPPAPNYGVGIPPSAAAPVFVPGAQQQQPQPQPTGMAQTGQGDVGPVPHANGAAPGNPNLISQEINGTLYFYDASQLPPVSGYPSYGGQPFVPVGMPGIVAPSPDVFLYPQAAPGMMYYPQ